MKYFTFSEVKVSYKDIPGLLGGASLSLGANGLELSGAGLRAPYRTKLPTVS